MPGQKRVFALDVPGIHVLTTASNKKTLDGRDKPGHDENHSGPVIAATLSQRHYSCVAVQHAADFPFPTSFPPRP
jgi:hypothetical protein